MKTKLLFVIPLLVSVLLVVSPNSFAQQVPFANVPFDINNIPEPIPPPAAVRDFFQLDSYYQQWINIRGFSVLASAEVRPYTVKEVAWTIGHMVGHRPDILKAMAQNKARFSIVPHNKHLSDIPEYDSGRLNFFWEMRARGVGGRITSSPEENIICGDRNYCYAEVIHEFAHQVHDYGLGNWGIQGVDPTFDSRLETIYKEALKEGLYQNRYAGSNRMEYWAEGVGSWFNGPNRESNVAHTRSALKEYDPRLAKLLTEVHGDGDWRYTPPATRTHLPHLQGFNPEEAPIYQRPARLLKLEAQLRDPNSDGNGKWVNLELHPPNQLQNLIASTTRGDRTDFIFLNLTGTDLSLYFFDVDGKKSLYQHSTTDDGLHVHTWVGAIWLIQDHTGKDLAVVRAVEQVGRVLIGGPPSQAVVRAVEQVGRVLIGGPPSQDVLDVNSDGIVDLLDLIPIASRYGHRGVNPADINKDRIVNIVDALLVAGSVSALPRQVVETFKAAEVQKWLTDAKQLDIEDEYQQKGIVVLEHLLAEMVFLSTPKEAAGQSETIFSGHTDIVWSVAFSSDGQTLASSGWDDKIRLWNAETKQHEITLIERADIMTVTFSPDGQTLASGNWDAAVRLWNPSTGEIKKTLIGHTDGIESVIFSPNGATLASGSADGTIRLWDPSTEKLKRTLPGQARMRSVAFSPDGATLASGSSDHTIQLWNPDTGKLKRTLPGHTDWVEGLAFSPDGNTLASGGGSEDRTLRLWNLHNGQQKKKFTGYTGAVSGIAFSPDGRLLASGGWGTKIRLWNTETGKDENALEGHTGGVFSVAFSLNGQLLVSGGKDGTVRLWEVPINIDIRQPAVVVQVEASEPPPMYWIDSEVGTLHRIVGTEVENLAPGVRNATDLAIDMTGGKLYWTERTSDRTGKIRQANLDGTNVQLVKELTSVPHGIALDAADGKIYLTNSWGKVQRLNIDGSNFESNLITGLEDLKDIAVDVVNHKVYWTEKTSDRSSRIRRANLDGSNVQQVKVLTNVPLSIAIDTSVGKIYLTDASGKVQRVNFDGSNFQSDLITGLKDPKGIAVDVVEGRVYWTEKGSIQRASFNGENIEEVVTNLGSPITLVLGMPPSSHVPSGTGTQETMTTPSTDINEDGKVDKSDLLLVVTALGGTSPTNPRVDVDGDGRVAIADLLLVIENLDDPVVGAAPAIPALPISVDMQALEAHLNLLRVSSDGSHKYEYAIAILEGWLASMRPTETQLLANYPNPLNPETWIPYQLSKAADVRLNIYSATGTLIRTFVLGHQPAGIYQNRSHAAYWDGKNELGEKVASGIYFYTLSADDFTATRKMIIMK